MDYNKIGAFIVERRKVLQMTQKDLANHLDRAVPHWERGIGCPDIGILEDLANLLQVSVLELLHGEKVNSINDVVIDILLKEKKKLKFWKKTALIGINFLGIVFS